MAKCNVCNLDYSFDHDLCKLIARSSHRMVKRTLGDKKI